VRIVLHRNSASELRGVMRHMGSHSFTCHPTHVNAPRLNPSQKAGTRFTYPWGMQGWVDLGYQAMHRPGVEPAISWSQVQCPNHYTTEQLISWHSTLSQLCITRIWITRRIALSTLKEGYRQKQYLNIQHVSANKENGAVLRKLKYLVCHKKHFI